MRISAWLFWALAVFFGLEGIGYALWQVHDQGHMEWTGTVALILSAVFSVLIAFYLMFSTARGRDRPLEDDPDAAIDDDDGEIGFFSPWSWWPVVVGFACFLIFLGFAVGIWICGIGAGLATVGLIGWVYEYYRGLHAR